MGNRTLEPTEELCISVHNINSRGIFLGDNALNYTTPLLMLQISIASVTTVVTSLLLKPLRQTLMVAHILAGIILGPSVFGSIHSFATTIFPLKNFVVLDTVSDFGTIFYFFLIGVQMDPLLVAKSGRKPMAIGIMIVLVPLLLSIACSILVTELISLDKHIARSLSIVGAAESLISFPVIAYYLTELKILNSQFGRLALSSSMVSGVVSWCFVTMAAFTQKSPGKLLSTIGTLFSAVALLVVIVFVLRPVVLWMIKRSPGGETIKEHYFCAIFAAVLALAFLSALTGQPILFGPFFLGVVIPPGPPLGSALVERLEFFNSWIIMPLYFVKHGLVMNVFSIRLRDFIMVELIILISCVGKFMGALVPCLYYKVPLKDVLSLGLTMNVQGVVEINLFHMLKDIQLIGDESFMIMCTSMVLVTGAVTPLVRALCNPSRIYVLNSRRTIQHSKPNTELRVLVCIHDQENVPAIIHLLKASYATIENPITVYVVHLMKLVGRVNPILISHKPGIGPISNPNLSQRIINVFTRYEQMQNSRGSTISVQPFTTVSPYVTMHNDVCTLALNKEASLIVIPYHKQSSGSYITGFRTVNCNILDNAPCSVGILVERVLLGAFRNIFTTWVAYHVAVLFLGGADDREVLTFATRMSKNPNIRLTVFRFSARGDTTSDLWERKLDEDVVSEFKISIVGNDRIVYIEEVVMDGSGIINVIRSMENNYQLIMVGRRHVKESPLILGLTEWKECTELGVIGDMFASSDFGGEATVLVVQQHDNVVRPHDDAAVALLNDEDRLYSV